MSFTATLPDARIARPGSPCSPLQHGDAVRILGHTDRALVVTVGHVFVLVLDADLVATAVLPENLSAA